MKTTWDFSPLFKNPSDQNIQKELERVKKESAKFINKWKDRTDYLEDPKVLREALDEYEKWQRESGESGNAGFYIWLRSTQELDNPKLKAWETKINDVANKLRVEMQFFTHRLAKINSARQQKFVSDPTLSPYKHFLEQLFAKAKFLLTEPEEKIMTLKAAQSHSNWVRMTEEFLSKEEREVLSDGNKREMKTLAAILSGLYSKNPSVRQSAGEAIDDICASHSATAEYELNSILNNKKIDDELRGMKRPDLARHLADDMDSNTVDLVIKSVSGRFDIPKRYYRLKAKLLGLKKPNYYDRNVAHFESESEYTFEEAVKLTTIALKKVDTEFNQIFQHFIQDGLIDVYPKKGKSDGAYCAHELITQPTYILLNHQDRLRNVTTLAHEVGHGINNELMRKKQNALNFHTPLSTAEVASTFMEDFVLEELAGELNDKEKLDLMMDKLNDDISTIFRQIACYRFEQDLHKSFRSRGHLSSKDIGGLFKKHMKNYLGETAEKSENWWIYWGHIRRFFYVYTYASGLLISKALQASVKKDPKFIKKVKDFLSAGTSDSPKNIFTKLGINIEDKKFWDQGLNEIEKLLDQTEELAKKLGKI